MNEYLFASVRGYDFKAQGETPEQAWLNLCQAEKENGSLWKTFDKHRNKYAVENEGFTPLDSNDFSKPVWKLVNDSKVNKPEFSNLLKLLLVASKKRNNEIFNLQFVRSVLGEEYHYEMKFADAFSLCLKAFMEALQYKQFEIAYRHDITTVMQKLFDSPTKSYTMAWRNKSSMVPSPSDSFTFEEYYDCLINHILTELMLTNVSWCKEQLPE